MSKSELHDWECAIEELSGNNADKMLDIAQDIYNTAFVRGKNYMTWEQPRWIPVSERLPDNTGWYLITFKNSYGDDAIVCEMSYRKPENYWTDKDISRKILDNDEVLAWMPLPSPYKPESEGE